MQQLSRTALGADGTENCFWPPFISTRPEWILLCYSISLHKKSRLQSTENTPSEVSKMGLSQTNVTNVGILLKNCLHLTRQTIHYKGYIGGLVLLPASGVWTLLNLYNLLMRLWMRSGIEYTIWNQRVCYLPQCPYRCSLWFRSRGTPTSSKSCEYWR